MNFIGLWIFGYLKTIIICLSDQSQDSGLFRPLKLKFHNGFNYLYTYKGMTFFLTIVISKDQFVFKLFSTYFLDFKRSVQLKFNIIAEFLVFRQHNVEYLTFKRRHQKILCIVYAIVYNLYPLVKCQLIP